MNTVVATYDPQAPLVTVTQAAAGHFATKLAKAGRQLIRLSVKTSGCTGYAYVLDYVAEPETADLLVPVQGGITLAVAADAANFVRGTQIDLVQEGVNRVIKYNNPNVVAECGCGESFSVAE